MFAKKFSSSFHPSPFALSHTPFKFSLIFFYSFEFPRSARLSLSTAGAVALEGDDDDDDEVLLCVDCKDVGCLSKDVCLLKLARCCLHEIRFKINQN